MKTSFAARRFVECSLLGAVLLIFLPVVATAQ
jgi:hypothetical protein